MAVARALASKPKFILADEPTANLDSKSATTLLEIMEKLKPDDLKIPSVAAYYSAILDAAGRTGAAQEYRKLASGASLLPEEEAILNVTPQPEPTPAPTPNTPEPKPTVSPGSIDQ